MKISSAFRDASRVYFGHFGATAKFTVVELCMTAAALTPALFLTENGLKYLALLAVPFWILLMFWARVNAAEAMKDALNGGSLFSMRLAEPEGYGKKLLYGIRRMVMLLLWAAPLIAAVVIARVHMSGETDGFTVLRMIKGFGGGDLMTGVLYLTLILVATILLLAFGCAFHSGDRHAFAAGKAKLLRGHHGKIVLCWICALAAVLPLLIAAVILVFRYLPTLQDLNGIMAGTSRLPATKDSLIIAGVGTVLTIPLLPLRSLITAAFVNGLDRENGEKE